MITKNTCSTKFHYVIFSQKGQRAKPHAFQESCTKMSIPAIEEVMQGCWGSVSEYFYFIEVFFNTVTGCVDKPGVNQPVSFLSPSYFRMVSCMTTQLSFLICPGIPLPPFPLTTRPILWHGHLPAVGCPCSCSDSVLESCLPLLANAITSLLPSLHLSPPNLKTKNHRNKQTQKPSIQPCLFLSHHQLPYSSYYLLHSLG